MSLKVGLALYSVRGEMRKDPIRTIERVGELGYKYVEAANYNLQNDTFLGFGVSPKAFKQKMDEFGIQLINCHVGIFDFWMDEATGQPKIDLPYLRRYPDDIFKSIVTSHLEAGNDLITVPMMFYPDDKAGILEICEYLNHLCDIARAEGGRVAYHSHFQEYEETDGKMMMDYLYENTNLTFEIDTFWAMRAERDPIEILKKYGDRVEMTHQKDFSKTTNIPVSIFNQVGRRHGCLFRAPDTYSHVTIREFMCCDPPEIFTEIGTGTMPIQEIIHATNQYTNAKYIILEQDFSSLGDEFKSVEVSMREFKKFDGIDWTQ